MAKFEGLIRAKQERALTETDCFCQWRVSYFVIIKEQLEASKSRQICNSCNGTRLNSANTGFYCDLIF